MRTYLIIALPLALILGTTVVGRVEAHRERVKFDSAAGMTLAAAPSRLPGSFTEELDAEQSTKEGVSLAARVSSPADQTPSDPQIRLVSPLQNQIVPIGETKVEIATANFTLDAAHRWRLYLDDKLIGTVENGATTFTLPILVSGPHEIKATLSDAEHDNLASAAIEVTAAPATPSTSPFNLPWVAAVMGALLIVVATLIVVALHMTRRRVVL
jgi:hypothetical protein